MRLGPLIVGAGGVVLVTAVLGSRARAEASRVAVRNALAGKSNGLFKARLTIYAPFDVKDAKDAKMEGAPVDRKGKPLHTVEDFFAGKSDHVSVSGDSSIWPYGQKLKIPWVDGKTVIGRVVDTGGGFHGSSKVYRVSGAEPLDICVATKKTKYPEDVVSVKIFIGDSFDKPDAQIAIDKFKDQTVALMGSGLDMLGAAMLSIFPCKGFGIKDGRGYGPYEQGYYQLPGMADELPLGPNREMLPSKDYDFQPGRYGDYLQDRQGPRKLAPGVTYCDGCGNWGTGKIIPQTVGGGFEMLGVA